MGATTTGTANVAVGSDNMATNTTGSNNTSVGFNTLNANTTADNNTAVGKDALAANTTGAQGTAVGQVALAANTTGTNNVAVGQSALASNTTASNNTAVGGSSLAANTTGSQNTAVGTNSLDACTTGIRNVAMGYNSLTALTTVNDNTAIGTTALAAVTTGSENTSLGSGAGGSITTGYNNICIGMSAMNHAQNTTTGYQNICIGGYSDTSNTDSIKQISLGYDVTCNENSSFVWGHAGTDSAVAFGATTITAPSDVRLKEEIENEKVGLDFINDLRPVTFRWKKAKDVPPEMQVHNPDSEERVMNGKYNHGFIAQEVKEVIDRYDLKDGFDMWKEDEVDGRQRIGEASLMPLMVKAVQELSAKVEELEDKLK